MKVVAENGISAILYCLLKAEGTCCWLVLVESLRPPSVQFAVQIVSQCNYQQFSQHFSVALSLSVPWRLLIITFLLIKVTFALQDPTLSYSYRWLIIGQRMMDMATTITAHCPL